MAFAIASAAAAQLVCLVLLSYAFFFEGFTGLAVTIGSVLTLFLVMQMTARVPWGVPFATKHSPRVGPPEPTPPVPPAPPAMMRAA